jgi:hypothetical protein
VVFFGFFGNFLLTLRDESSGGLALDVQRDFKHTPQVVSIQKWWILVQAKAAAISQPPA